MRRAYGRVRRLARRPRHGDAAPGRRSRRAARGVIRRRSPPRHAWQSASASASAASAGFGSVVQPEDARDHRLHLRLVGVAVAGDGGLDLGGRVQPDGQAALGRGMQRDAAGLGGAHHGAARSAARTPARRRPRRAVLVDHARGCPRRWRAAAARAARRAGCGRRRRAPASPPVGRDVDDADAAPGQPGSTPSTRRSTLPRRSTLVRTRRRRASRATRRSRARPARRRGGRSCV